LRHTARRLAVNSEASIAVMIVQVVTEAFAAHFQTQVLAATFFCRSFWQRFGFVDNDGNPQEVMGGTGSGHGTFVSGLVALTAPGSLIMPLRAFGPDGSGILQLQPRRAGFGAGR
jgi:hypothetical protein